MKCDKKKKTPYIVVFITYYLFQNLQRRKVKQKNRKIFQMTTHAFHLASRRNPPNLLYHTFWMNWMNLNGCKNRKVWMTQVLTNFKIKGVFHLEDHRIFFYFRIVMRFLSSQNKLVYIFKIKKLQAFYVRKNTLNKSK